MKSSFYSITPTDIRVSLKDLAAILEMLAKVMLLPILATVYYNYHTGLMRVVELSMAFILPSAVLYILYLLSRMLGLDSQPKTKNIMITVALAWLIIALVGAIPFMARGALTPLDSFFESMSGWTTTGFSMITDFERTERDILFYRGLSQGVGGLGLISLGMMVMLQGTNVAIGYSDVGIQKIKPGIRATILESWKIYGLYILFGVVFLHIAGMNFFDAANHSMAAIATGGFTTHSDIGYFNNIWVEVVLMVLMFLGMTSFILHYRIFNGEWNALKGDEVKYTLALVSVSILVISVSFWGRDIPGVNTQSLPDIGRKVSFYVISGMSTCGFNTVDYGKWPDFAKTFMISLMYIGGMSSSTAGGIKVIRFVIIVKAVHYSLKKLILPKSSVVVMKVDGRALKDDIFGIASYSAIYISITIMLSMGLMLLGYGGIDSIATIMSSMGNAGLAVISGTSWNGMSYIGKLIIILAMYIGRIEIYPALLFLRVFMDRFRVY